jgi:hypothetical protein
MRQQIQLGQFAQFTIDVPAPLKPIREKQRGCLWAVPRGSVVFLFAKWRANRHLLCSGLAISDGVR